MSEPRRSTLEALAKGLARPDWRCEPILLPYLDVWLDVMGPDYVPQGKQGRRQLYAAMRDVMAEVPERQARSFFDWARRRMYDERLTIVSPRSFLWLVPTWRKVNRGLQGGGDTYEGRERYLKGDLAGEE